MRAIYQLFLKGLVIFLPISVTIYLILWIGGMAESIFALPLKKILGAQFYIPGLGLLITFCFILFLGFLVSHYVTQKIVNWAIEGLENLPVIKVIYRPLKDLMNLFGKEAGAESKKRVVLVTIPALGGKCLGLVTSEKFDEFPPGAIPAEHVTVYIPMSYAFGGYTVLVPRDSLVEVNIPVEKAMNLAVTGWIKGQKNKA